MSFPPLHFLSLFFPTCFDCLPCPNKLHLRFFNLPFPVYLSLWAAFFCGLFRGSILCLCLSNFCLSSVFVSSVFTLGLSCSSMLIRLCIFLFACVQTDNLVLDVWLPQHSVTVMFLYLINYWIVSTPTPFLMLLTSSSFIPCTACKIDIASMRNTEQMLKSCWDRPGCRCCYRTAYSRKLLIW